MAIQRGMRVAISMAIGAASVEFLQSYIALSFYHILTHNEEMERSLYNKSVIEEAKRIKDEIRG